MFSVALEIKATPIMASMRDQTERQGPYGEKVIWGYNTTQPAHDEEREGK